MIGYLFTFSSTHDAIAARKALTGRCAFTVLPTPRALSASCGISIQIPEAELPPALEILHGLALCASRASLYQICENNGKKTYEPATI